MPLGAPVADGTSPTSAMSAVLSGSMPAAPGQAAQAINAQLQQLAGQVRDIGDQIKQLVAANPPLAQDGQQIMDLLKGMIIKAAEHSQMQTMSGAGVPGAGGG